MKSSTILAVALCLAFGLGRAAGAAPMGTAFTYQGRLIDANSAADGLYDFQFKLYADPNDGNQKGSTITTSDLDVIDGYFTTQLDFGSSVFDGNDRCLEIGVRPGASTGAFTILDPRQWIAPMPYALYALNAGGSAGGADADWIISGNNMYSGVSGNVGIGTASPTNTLQVGDGYGTRFIAVNGQQGGWSGYKVMAGGTQKWFIGLPGIDQLYVKNSSNTDIMVLRQDGNVSIGTTNLSVKFAVQGDISAGSVYKIGSDTVLSVPGYNTLIGLGAGAVNTGICNTFSGYNAGYFNTTGYNNTFTGYHAGYKNTTGYFNTFSGYQAGRSNTEGLDNTFLGYTAGYSNTTGNFNAFVGTLAGNSNTTGSQNTYLGHQAGVLNTGGTGNVFIGCQAGYNETGSNKLYITNSVSTTLIYGDFPAKTLGFGTTSIPAGRAINTWTGAYLTTGGTWTNSSSRDMKENITPVDGREVLEKLVKVPVSTWNYKIEDVSKRHMGPMAQDLYKVFELNDSDESIATVDSDGISFAAIQGLYQMVKEKDTVIESLQKENNEIRNRLSMIESLFAKLSLTQEGGIK